MLALSAQLKILYELYMFTGCKGWKHKYLTLAGACLNYRLIFIWITIYLPTQQCNVHSLLSLHWRAINRLLKFASYHTQKTINVLLLKSLPMLMFSKLNQLIAFGTFQFLLTMQSYLVQMKVSNDKDRTGNILMER